MNYKAVLFDLDGTLLNTLHDIADSMNNVLSGEGYPGHDYDAYPFFIGNGLTNLVRRSLPDDHRDPDQVRRCLSLVKKAYRANWNHKTVPYPNIEPMLKELKQRGLILGVLSNKDHEFTVEMVAHYFSEGLFTVVAGAKPDVPLKPSPEPAYAVLSALSVPASEAVFVGDSAVDIETGVNAGLFPIGVSWGFRPVQELLEAGAGKIIDQPRELLDFLGQP